MREIKTRRLSMTFAGCFLGAGFVSGQELWQFFGAFGKKGLWGLILSVALLMLSGAAFMAQAKRTGTEEMDKIIVRSENKFLKAAVGGIQCVFLFGIVTVMCAGAGALINQIFGLPAWIFSLVFIILVSFAAVKGLSGIMTVFSVGVPVIAAAAVIFAVYNLCVHGAANADFTPAQNTNGLLPNAWIAACTYAAYNIFSSIGILAPFGKRVKNTKTIFLSVLLGGALLTGVAFGVLTSMAFSGDCVNTELPMLAAAMNINKVCGYIYGLLLLLGMYSTSLSCLVAFTNYASLKLPVLKKHNLTLTLVCGAMVFAASLSGFGALVGTVYPVSGYICVILLILFAENFIHTRRTDKHKQKSTV